MRLIRVVVVEDDPTVARDIRKRLKRMGYNVIPDFVPSGEEAIEKAEQVRPDLVLMDIGLKGKMDGIEAAEVIQNRFGIPIIYLTALGDKMTEQRAKRIEVGGNILKPFKDTELHTSIQMALKKVQ